MALSSHREGFSSDVSWSILTRLRQTCQNQTCQHQTCQRRFRDCAGSGIVPVHELCRVYIEQISLLDEKIGGLDKEIQHRAKTDEGTSRLMTISGVGPMCATPLQAFSPQMEAFANGLECAAWCGLLPRQKPTSGRQILCLTWPDFAKFGRVSKMGRRDSRRLLITGSMAVMRRAIRKGPPIGAWLAKMLAGKRRMLVATALANKLTRTVWALTTRKDVNRIPPLAA